MTTKPQAAAALQLGQRTPVLPGARARRRCERQPTWPAAAAAVPGGAPTTGCGRGTTSPTPLQSQDGASLPQGCRPHTRCSPPCVCCRRGGAALLPPKTAQLLRVLAQQARQEAGPWLADLVVPLLPRLPGARDAGDDLPPTLPPRDLADKGALPRCGGRPRLLPARCAPVWHSASRLPSLAVQTASLQRWRGSRSTIRRPAPPTPARQVRRRAQLLPASRQGGLPARTSRRQGPPVGHRSRLGPCSRPAAARLQWQRFQLAGRHWAVGGGHRRARGGV